MPPGRWGTLYPPQSAIALDDRPLVPRHGAVQGLRRRHARHKKILINKLGLTNDDGSIDADSYIRFQSVFEEGLAKKNVEAIAELFPDYVPDGQDSDVESEEEEE